MGRCLSIICICTLSALSAVFCQQDNRVALQNSLCFSSSFIILEHDIDGMLTSPSHNHLTATGQKNDKGKLFGNDSWFGRDKANHLTVSAALVGFGYYATREEIGYGDCAARNSAIGFSLACGIAKEVYDWTSHKGHPSFKDIVADIVGVGVGIVMISLGD